MRSTWPRSTRDDEVGWIDAELALIARAENGN
jgi:hypothetical protein